MRSLCGERQSSRQSVYAENVKVRVSLCGERQSLSGYAVYAENVKVLVNAEFRVSLFGERQSSSRQFWRRTSVYSRQLKRRTSKFASVDTENVKFHVSLWRTSKFASA